MKKTNLIKGILLILLCVVLIGVHEVYATSFESEFDNMIPTSNTSNTSTNTAIDEDDEPLNLTSNTSTTTSNTSSSLNTSTNTSTKTNSNNSSVYTNKTNTNTNLPKTGIEDSLPTIVLIVLLAISAIYAYKKISDYKNV